MSRVQHIFRNVNLLLPVISFEVAHKHNNNRCLQMLHKTNHNTFSRLSMLRSLFVENNELVVVNDRLLLRVLLLSIKFLICACSHNMTRVIWVNWCIVVEREYMVIEVLGSCVCIDQYVVLGWITLRNSPLIIFAPNAEMQDCAGWEVEELGSVNEYGLRVT